MIRQINKRPKDHIANLDINTHNKISFLESYTKYLHNVLQKILLKRFSFFFNILMLDINPLLWLDDILSHSEHSSSQEDLKHIKPHQTLNPAWINFNTCPIARGKYNRTSGKWNYESACLIGQVKIWINVLLKLKKNCKRNHNLSTSLRKKLS